MFLDFVVLATLPDRFILEEVPLDLMERGPLRSGGFLELVLTCDLRDLDAMDFLPLVLRLKTVPFSSYTSSSS